MTAAVEISSDGRSPEAIEHEIARTRERMGARLEELGQRLSPDHLKRQAREAIVEKVEDTRSRAVRLARRRPVPLAASVIGAAGLMLLRSRRGGAAASRGPAQRHPVALAIVAGLVGLALGVMAPDGHARGYSGLGPA